MKTLNKYTALMFLVYGLVLIRPDAWAYPGKHHYISENYSNEMTVLNPGWRTSCNSNFVVENLNENPAEIQIHLGQEAYQSDSIMGNGKRLYDLRKSLSFAKQLGKTVTMDDVALVTNHSENSSILIHC